MLKQTGHKVELITRAPRSGIWRMGSDGGVTFQRPALTVTSAGDESEAFYLRVCGQGDWCYQGADLGVLMTRGRMQRADRRLLDRPRRWNAATDEQFASVAPAPAQDVEPPADQTAGKWR